jgi:hypothetical protein
MEPQLGIAKVGRELDGRLATLIHSVAGGVEGKAH